MYQSVLVVTVLTPSPSSTTLAHPQPHMTLLWPHSCFTFAHPHPHMTKLIPLYYPLSPPSPIQLYKTHNAPSLFTHSTLAAHFPALKHRSSSRLPKQTCHMPSKHHLIYLSTYIKCLSKYLPCIFYDSYLQ